MTRFMGRNGLQTYAMYDKAGEVNLDQDIVLRQIDDNKANIRIYPMELVYDLDETGIYCQAPARTIATEQIAGVKKEKQRITVTLAVNADGSHKLQTTLER